MIILIISLQFFNEKRFIMIFLRIILSSGLSCQMKQNKILNKKYTNENNDNSNNDEHKDKDNRR